MTLDTSSWRFRRLVVLGVVLVLLAPAVVSGLTHEPDTVHTNVTVDGNATALSNVTFAGIQGPFGTSGHGRVVAVDTDSGELLWEYANESAAENVLYYDVDPLSAQRLLFVEERSSGNGSAIVYNWQTDELIDRFEVPSDTHDVDALGNDRYVVADKYNHRAYVYDASAQRIVWEYRFAEHFPEYPEAGEAPSSEPSGVGGYTHLNDVDVVDNGSAFLLSPRNFDRVVLVNRSTKTVEWTLGEQDNHDIIKEQHNPDLLQRDPPVVLIADSENDRVVEYRRTNDTWTRTWAYSGSLHWPRDADRLPNGNTLIVDTYGQRVLEVTPDHEIVWERDLSTMPYDAERLGTGPGSDGPPIDRLRNASTLDDGESGVSIFRQFYDLSLYILPTWIGFVEFYGVVGAILGALLWTAIELGVRIRDWRTS
ncbi:hypothetical protein Hrd1104_09785 [Halorhabdus sp. CBA1104]|uniref:outer membrane protein assembly factor BamB family protein n=1 Tax=unclassified Halorhabdus TaxID=2621901 RepID=UPI0012B210DA|nr:MULTISPECIES: aryl-sulfate sulfotransferase [unclassified Halorhabdus]QGN07567.1 hypothetical protein Hrd1104_09785 [Halorhabdus sp. CBA1104]